MATYEGTAISKVGFGRQDDPASLLVKISWDANLATGDFLRVNGELPEGFGLLTDDVEVFGTLPDTNATQTFALKVGTENDDDAFVTETVIAQTGQLFLKGTGAAIGSTVIDADDIIAEVTADPATAVAAGDLFIKLTGRLRLK